MNKVEAVIRAQAKSAFKARNPHFFNNTHSEALEPSKQPINDPGSIAKRSRNDLAGKFLSIWKILNGPGLEQEFRFHPGRKFRVDFCHLASRTCIEIEGGIFRKGGHSSVSGILRDIEKYNEMEFLGFRLFRFHGKDGVAGSVDVANITRLICFLERSAS